MFPSAQMHSHFTIFPKSLEEYTKKKIQRVAKRWSEITHFCMTTISAESCHDKMTTSGCQKCDKVVRRSSNGCHRGFIGPFQSYDELFT